MKDVSILQSDTIHRYVNGKTNNAIVGTIILKFLFC